MTTNTDKHFSRSFTAIILAALVAMLSPVLLHAQSRTPGQPIWTVPLKISSNDGNGVLEWQAASGSTPELYQLEEEFGGSARTSYVAEVQLPIYRAAVGEYLFRLRACIRDESGFPNCGPVSKTLKFQVTEELYSAFITKDSAPPPPIPAAMMIEGGPDQMQPGMWHSAQKPGHGWSFFWKNSLVASPSLPSAYDLYGVWYTYEAKTVIATQICEQPAPPCGLDIQRSNYRPVVARMQLTFDQDLNKYTGGIYVTRAEGSPNIGSATITFGANNTVASINWNASLLHTPGNAIDSITLLAGEGTSTSIVSPTDLSGLWAPASGSYFIVDNIADGSEAVQVVFNDSRGDPVWIQASYSGSLPVTTSTNLCFFYVKDGGYPPATVPVPAPNLILADSGCISSQAASGTNRNGTRAFSAFETGQFWASFTLPTFTVPPNGSPNNYPTGGSIAIGSSGTPATLLKQTNFHRIYTIGGNTCAISTAFPQCGALLTRFTDGRYPSATVYAFNTTTQQRTLILTSSEPVIQGHVAQLSAVGTYIFELRQTNSTSSRLIAQSAAFTVTQEPASTITFSESFEGTFTAQWTQDAQNDWAISTQRATAGTKSAEVDGPATDAQLISIPINLQGKSQATINFRWLIESTVDTSEYLAFDVSTNGGTTWTERARLRGNVDTEDVWYPVQIQLTGISSLRLRFRGHMSDDTEDANVDNIIVTIPSPNTPPVVTSPGPQTTVQNTAITPLVIQVTDAESNPVTCAFSGLPAGLSESSECTVSGTVTAAPNTYSVTVTANDGTANSSPVSFNWTVTAPPPPDITAFSESFEGTFTAQWTQDGQNGWAISTQRATAGTKSAEVDGPVTNAELTSIPVNLQGSSQATITFSWLIESALDTNEYLAFYTSTNGGSSWIERARLRGNVDTENVWHPVQIPLTGISSLRLRFRGHMSDDTEDANVDNVIVTIPQPTNTPPVVTSPGTQTTVQNTAITPLVIQVTDAESNPVTCSFSGLPTGLSESSECTISGTPTAAPNTYTVTVTAHDGLVNSTPVNFNWTVTTPPTGGVAVIPDDVLTNVNARSTSHNATVGALAGQADVSGGQSVYSIPINVPPGRQGVQPSLALNYSSRAGNGVAGMGWSISGLSSISRCPATIAQDGFMRGVGFAATDRLCLDGQRLIKVNSGDYWAAASEYRTEIDSFSRIKLSSGSGATSTSLAFTVETKEGLLRTYAYRANVKSDQGATQTQHWLLTEEKDPAGNTVKYQYSEKAPGDHELDYIAYTGLNSTAGNRRVEFTYGSRCLASVCDENVAYTAGYKSSQKVLLTTITTCISSSTCGSSNYIRRYALNHVTSDATKRLLLSSVTEAAWSGSSWVSLPATTFAWSKEKPTFSAPEIFSRKVNGIETPITNICDYLPRDTLPEDLPAECSVYHPGMGHSYPEIGASRDLDGDGIAELSIVARDSLNSSAMPKEHALSVSAESVQKAYFQAQITFKQGVLDFNYYQPLGDMNNDGRADIVIPESISGGTARTLKVAIWDGTGEFTPAQAGLGHFALKTTGITVSNNSSYDAGTGNHGLSQLFVRDINNDGWSDLVLVLVNSQGPYVKIYLNDTRNQASNDTVTLCATCQNANAFSHVMSQFDGGLYVGLQYQRIRDVTDLNGDGLPDLMFEHLASIDMIPVVDQVRFNTSNSSPNANLTFGPAMTPGDVGLPGVLNPHWMDVNGDGLLDVVTGSFVYFNRGIPSGTQLFGAVPITGDEMEFRRGTRMVVDWNADGRDDMVFPDISETGLVGDEYCIVDAFWSGDDGDPSSWCPITFRLGEIGHLHAKKGSAADYSVYEYDVLQFETKQDSNGNVLVNATRQRAGFQASPGSRPQLLDVNGDGLTDYVNAFFCKEEIDYYQPKYDENGDRDNENNCVGEPLVLALIQELQAYSEGSLSSMSGMPISLSSGGGPEGPQSLSTGTMSIENPNTYRVMNTSANPSDMLLEVVDGLGNIAQWDYWPLSSDAERPGTFLDFYELPSRDNAQQEGYVQYGDNDYFYFTSSMYVVSEFRQTNGLITSGQPRFNKRFYGYEEAVYNNQGRGFQGFRAIHVEDVNHDDPLNDTLTYNYFHQIFPLAGKLESSTTFAVVNLNPNQPLVEKHFNWNCRTAVGGVVATCGIPTSTISLAQGSYTGVFHPILSQTAQSEFELASSSSFSTKTVDRIFDAYGNPTKETSTTVDTGLLTHTLVTDYRYTYNTTNWWINRLDATLSTASVAYVSPHTVPSTGISGFVSPQTSVITTSLHGWNTSLRKPSCVYQVSGNFFSSTVANSCGLVTGFSGNPANKSTLGYDSYGNPTSLAIDATKDGGGTITQRSTTTAYSSDNYFPQSVTNAESHTAVTLFNANHGVPLKVVDANNLVTMMEYDAFGREIERYYPNGCTSTSSASCTIASTTTLQHYAPRSSTHYVWGSGCPGSNCDNQVIAYQVISYQDGAPKVTTTFDRFNRPRKTSSTGLSGTTQNDVTYNGRGQVVEQSEPYFSAMPLLRSFTYDPLGRTVRKKQPQRPTAASSDQSLYTHYVHAGLTTTVRVTNSATLPTGTCAASPTVTLSSNVCVQRTYSSGGQLLKTLDAHGFQTRFWHDGQGNAKLIQDSSSNYTAANYNGLGQRSLLQDPDMGRWTFLYDGLGEVISQTDAKAQTTTLVYDRLGRLTQRSAAGGIVDTYVYDSDGLGNSAKGLLGTESRNIGGGTVEYRRQYYYDGAKLPTGHRTELFAESGIEVFDITLDNDRYFARPLSLTYPQVSGADAFRLYYRYNASGQVIEEGDSRDWSDANKFLRKITALSPRGQITAESYGNGLSNTYTYAAANGQMFTSSVSNGLYHLDYQYDQYGNLTRTADLVAGVNETYTYDHLHRLKSAIVSNGTVTTTTYAYDALGNLTQKSDYASSYLYQKNIPFACSGAVNAGPHAVTQAGTRTFSYDANGNQLCEKIGTSNFSIAYDAFNLPLTVNRGNQASFRYGSDHQRYFQSATAPATTTVYIDKLYERINGGTHKFYVGDYAIVQVGGSAPGTRYLHRDRLNSVVAITGADGVEKGGTGRLFDPFGKPRNDNMSPTTPTAGLLNGTAETTRGFTQHEHLNNVQLIHMNGRAYDYNLGRFLSVDPIIQFPENSQSLNPYSYLMNNPMAGTDPSGYAFDCSKSNCDVITLNQRQTQQQRDVLRERWLASKNGQSGSPKNGSGGSAKEKINAPGAQTDPSDGKVDIYALGPPPTVTEVTLFRSPPYAGGMEQEFEPMPLLLNVGIAATIALIGGHNPFTGENAPGDDSIEGGAFSPVGIFKAGATAAGSLILRRGTSAASAAGAASAGAQVTGQGFRSFSSLKRALGPAGSGKHWHHVVEQTPGNVGRFGAGTIHNSQNVMALDATVHTQISAYYSRIQPFSNGQTVRQWLSTQSFDTQRQFGQQILRDFGALP